MGRSRYRVTEPDRPHFLTSTVVDWVALFTRPEVVEVVFESWRWLRVNDAMRLHGYVVMENHLHWVAQSPALDRTVARFHSFTARSIIDRLREARAQGLLERLQWGRSAHKRDRVYQVWQEGAHPELIWSEEVMRQKLEYIHHNPVKRGYVTLPEHWRYSSAGHYAGENGVMEVDAW